MMSEETIKVKVFRFDPEVDQGPSYQTYHVPFEKGMSAMDVLDYIYHNLDGTLAYYDHAGCSLGICGRCTGKINGKPGLFCQTVVEKDVKLDPLSEDNVLRDLVIKRAKTGGDKANSEPEKENMGVMGDDINSVSILVRREIEALIAAPLIKAYMEEFGKERAFAVAGRVIKKLALEGGKMLAVIAGGNTMEHLQKAIPMFSMGGALEFEVLEASEKKASVNVIRCRYAEMYKEHGLEEFGYLLSCGRDYALMEGFNPKIKFVRTQTIMEGSDICDFRFEAEDD
jgi:fumarate reductase iron-sulfur subunit